MEDREVFINTGAKNSQFNISYIDGMPDAFCGRPEVTIKFVNIVNGLELINEDLKGIYLLHKQLEKIYSSGMNEVMAEEASKLYFKYQKMCRSVIHDLRVTCDMFMILTSILKNYKQEICIGNYYEKYDNGEVRWYDESFRSFFLTLTQCDNSSKHHFLTDMNFEFDFEHYSFSYLFCRDNCYFKNYKEQKVSITDIVEQFNNFYEAVIIFFRSGQISENN